MTGGAAQPGPRRALVLGNSHIAAVKGAHEREAALWPGRWSGLAPEFAGGHGDALAMLEVREGRLLARTEAARQNLQRLNRHAEWALAEYDAFIVVGCQLGIYRALMPYRSARFLGLPSMAEGGAAERGAPRRGAPRVPVSRAMFDLAVREGVRQTLGGALALRLVAGLRAAGLGAQVIVAEQPRPSFDCRRERRRFAGLLQAHRLGDGAVLTEVFEAAAAAALPGITFLAQPVQTRHGGMFTRPRFSAGSVRLTASRRITHPEDDFIHANADYGALVLDQVAAALA
ncbi:MAG: hypothetical protein H5U17_12350 [Defluviimonas sp.]|nr:hypothetical protein [Defluviimonas sp.]